MIIADISITIAQHVVSENIGFETVGNRSVMADFLHDKLKLVLEQCYGLLPRALAKRDS